MHAKKDHTYENVVHNILGINETLVENAKVTANTLESVANILETLMYEIRFVIYLLCGIGFVVEILFFKVFLYHPVSILFGRASELFLALSEGWKIAIVSLVSVIPLGIITTVIAHFIISWLNSRLERFLKR